MLKEKDNVGIGMAKKLADLYDCRTCVNHVAQMYDKGIIEAVTYNDKLIFGMKNNVSFNEAQNIANRVCNKSERLCDNQETLNDKNRVGVVDNKEEKYASEVTYNQALEEIKKGNNLIIDLRNQALYSQWHISNAINETLTNVLDGKIIINQDLEAIFVYCEKGYQSEIAANYFVANENIDAYYFAVDAL